MPKRELAIDLLKLGALATMLWAHCLAFLYAGDNLLLRFSQNWGNIVSFTTFLLASAALTYIAYLNPEAQFSKRRYFKRALLILGMYYLLAFIVSAKDILFLPLEKMLAEAVNIILLIKVPGYTEYLLPFVFYAALVLLAPRLVVKLARKPWLGIALALVVFVLGELLVRATAGIVAEPVVNWGSLLYGSFELYRFPIMQYFPVFVFGLILGRVLRDHRINLEEQKLEAALVVLALIIVTAVSFVAGPAEILRRWPPSIGFLAIGIAWCMLQIVLFVTWKLELKLPWFVQAAATYSGRNLLPLVVIHMAVLSIYRQFGLPQFGGIAVVFGFAVTVVLSVLLREIIRVLKRYLVVVRTRRILKPLIILVSIVVLVIAGISLVRLSSGYNQLPLQPDPPVQDKVLPSWYDNYSRVALVWKLAAGCCNGYTEVDFSHQNYIAQKYSLDSGYDLRLVLWDGQASEELEFFVSGLNAVETKLATDLSDFSELNRAGELQLYLGDLHASAAHYEKSVYPERIRDTLTVEPEERFPLIRLPFARQWHLTDANISLEFSTPELLSEADGLTWVLIKALDKDNSAAVPAARGNILWSPDRNLKLEINLAEHTPKIAAGEYYLGVDLDPSESTHKVLKQEGLLQAGWAGYLPIIISEPVYMTWTIDWEGYDLAENFMRDLERLSSQYKMPITQFFNPRIYTNPAVNANRAKALTNWVKQRHSLGDEIALHLHMHYDLVAAAGLTPKTDPRWGGRVEGHDVLTTAYNEQEFSQIVNWAVNKFREHGLPKPVGYRAGAWFMDLDNLRALDKLGFSYDSSGSDYKEPYGPNRQSRNWDLTPTSRPYQISRNNQNSSAAPLLNLWEYPNNGADSTNRTSDELLRRLRLNLGTPGSVVSQAQVLTYLSHPHWLDIDRPKMEALFNAQSLVLRA